MNPEPKSVPMPMADVVDRLAIALLKKHVGGGGQDIDDEIVHYNSIVGASIQADECLIRLLIFNALIWSAEADIRNGKDGELGLAEVGRRALDIRAYNAMRIKVKAEIARACGQFEDRKVNHASAE